VTWQKVWLDPRSTWSHCGSEKALDQRVPVLPSTAAEAGVPAFSVDDAVAGCPAVRLVLLQLAAEASGTAAGSASPASSSNPLVSRIAASRSRCLGPDRRAAPWRLAGLRGVWSLRGVWRRVGFRTSTSLEMAAP
jgi:hypothetical protein